MHHTKTLAQETDYEVVHEELEEACVAEMAENKRVNVPLVQTI